MMKNFENDNNRSTREESDGRQERQPAYKAFVKDKRNATRNDVPDAMENSEFRSSYNSDRRGYDSRNNRNNSDGKQQSDRPYYNGDQRHKQYGSNGHGGYSKYGNRTDKRTENRNGEKLQRHSFNPNFDENNRPINRLNNPERRDDYGTPRNGYAADNGYSKDRQQKPSYGNKFGRRTEENAEMPERRQYDRYGKPFDRNERFQFRQNEGRFERRNREEGYESYPTFPAETTEDKIRLNRYIAMSGICSRREADSYIQSGAVTVNGLVVTELGAKVSQNDEIRFNGEIIKNERKVYIVMNKPKGYVTSVEDPHADKTVMDLLKGACRERVYPVGRLDKNSLGVLLITNDGDLAKKLMHPSYEKKKIYQLILDKPLARADMNALVEGFELEDGEIHADEVSYLNEKKTEIGIEIHSGRNRIVRRMLEHLGYKVIKLDRVYFAGLTKQKLKRGAWRFLTPREVQTLRSGQYE